MKRKKIAVENADAFIESTATKQATTALNTRFLIGIGSISKAIRIKHIPPPLKNLESDGAILYIKLIAAKYNEYPVK